MGHGGARYRAVGIAAMMRWVAMGAALLLLGGCNSIGAAAGAVAGVATGAATTNPLVGTAVGVGTKAAVDVLVKYISRKRQEGEQDAIAEAAGNLPIGGTTSWQIRHTIPIGDEHGTLQVVSAIANPLAVCREIVFTVIDGKDRANYVTTECQDGAQWKWAQAEPATARWGFLQ